MVKCSAAHHLLNQCIAWGTAAYAKQHHLSFADTTDLEAKVTNEDGYGYVTMVNVKKSMPGSKS